MKSLWDLAMAYDVGQPVHFDLIGRFRHRLLQPVDEFHHEIFSTDNRSSVEADS